jgi:hypothetical protein
VMRISRNCFVAWAPCFLLLTTLSLPADQLQMQNGDRYAGRIVSMTSNSIVLESDVLGKVTLPREKVSAVSFCVKTLTNTPATPAAKTATTNLNVATALHAMSGGSNSIEQVRQQMLTGADPAATQKYNELVGGLMSGKLNVNDIRNEARTSIQQINKLKQELGPEAGDTLDSYLAILQAFVDEAAPVTMPPVPAPAVSPMPAHAAPYAPAASFGTNSSTTLRAK